MEEEYYVQSKEYPNYEVSNLGNIRNRKTGTIRKLTNRNGYRKIRINNKDINVHKMVGETFFEGDHTGLEINHKDGNKANNTVNNLEWVTASENVKHAYRTGLKHRSGCTPWVKVIDESTGKVYENAVECAKDIGGTGPGIIYALNRNGLYKGRPLKRYEGE